MSKKRDRVLKDALAPRVIGDGDPNFYTPEELRVLVELGQQYGRGLLAAGSKMGCRGQAEVFRRQAEMIWIFRGLSPGLRNHPSGENTRKTVLSRLKQIGIRCSERTLARDYRAVGGADFLRAVTPFEPGEERSPLLSPPTRE